MSIVHSSADSQTARRVRGGVDSFRSTAQTPSAAPASGFATAIGALRSGISTPAVRHQLGDELAEDDRLAVGDEVGVARLALASRPARGPRRRCPRGSSRSGACPPPIQEKRPFSTASFERGHDRRVAGAPDEARPQDDGLEALAVRVEHGLLGHRLRRRVVRLRVGPQRHASRRRSRAAGPRAAPPRCPRARTAARPPRGTPRSAFFVPVTLPWTKSSRRPQSPSDAAAWNAYSQPSRARGHRGDVVQVAHHRLGAAPRAPSRPSESERASALHGPALARRAGGSAARR